MFGSWLPLWASIRAIMCRVPPSISALPFPALVQPVCGLRCSCPLWSPCALTRSCVPLLTACGRVVWLAKPSSSRSCVNSCIWSMASSNPVSLSTPIGRLPLDFQDGICPPLHKQAEGELVDCQAPFPSASLVAPCPSDWSPDPLELLFILRYTTS